MPILDQISHLDNVLILGFAREGRSLYHFLRSRFPNLTIGIADQKHPDSVPNDSLIETFFGKKYLTNSLTPKAYGLVFKSAGISPHLPEIKKAKSQGITFSSITKLFFELCPGKIIGITGTKGKSTTASLLYHVLATNDVKSVLVGNIGKPSLDYLPEITPDTWVVCELSSYQLMDLDSSPHITVFLNIYPDHLDYHKSFREYKSAKLNITKYQTPHDYLITPLKIVTKARLIPLILPDSPIQSRLLGAHNQYNIMPSVIIGKLLGLPQDKIINAIKSYTPLETRLEKIATKRDITFYADTLATIPEATIAAIEALHPHTLIAGGHERFQKYSGLAKKILESGVSTLILFPATGPRLWATVISTQALFPRFTLPAHFPSSSMAEAVKLACDHTPPGKICLLSPAAPSFTLFKDYKDEYRQYKSAISTSS